MIIIESSEIMSRENQKMRSDKIKREIVDTALGIALEEGFDALSIRKISGRMNYSTGIIYYHFKDKQEIVDAIQKKEGQVMEDLIWKAYDSEKGAAHNLRRVFYQIMLLALSEGERYNLMARDFHSRNEESPPLLLDLFSKEIKKGMDSGELKPGDPEKTIYAIWCSFMGFNMNISQRTDLTLKEAKTLFDIQINMVLDGIAARS